MKHRIIIVIFLICLLFSGYGIPALPAAGESAVTAASGSADDIQAAIDTVYAAGGGTVYIPEGDFNLGGNVLIHDNVSLIGAGLDKTILRTVGSYVWIKAQGNDIRISGFSLINTNNDGNIYGYDGIVINNCVDFRVDHLYIDGYAEAGVEVHGVDTRGVIDHCEIKVNVIGDEGYGVAVYRDDFWEEDMKLGSAEATFIEDCVFVNARHAVAANSGAHYVFRHNLVKQGVVSHQVDAHGGKDTTNRGARAIEVYENVIEDPVSGDDDACFIRGGGGVIFNNTIRGYRYSIEFTIERAQIGQPYPILDQVHDFWVWNNPHDGSDPEVAVTAWSVNHTQENRDYFRYAKPGYTPYPYPHPLTLGSGNQPPVLNPIGNKSVNVGQLLEFTVSAIDPDGGPLTYSTSNLPQGATFISATQNFSWIPDRTGTFNNVHIEVSDGALADSEDITIIVNAENTPPVVGNDTYNVDEDNSLSVAAPGVLANDSDADGDPLTALLVSGVSNGSLTLNNDGSFSYTPRTGYTGADSFTYTANDGKADSNTATVALTVNPPSTIAVTDFASYRVFQRDIGGTSKSVPITGIYANMDWSRVEARVLGHGIDTAVVGWTPIDSTPGGGTFSGNLVVPQGGWYDIEVRAIDSGGTVLGSSRGTNKWGVGMVILCIGQSNMVGHGQQPFTAVSSDLAVNYSNAGVWEHLADPYDDGSPPGAVDNDNSTAGGSMIPALANSLLQTFDFPIAFVPSAKDGSNLYSQWAFRNSSNHFDTTTLYGQSITKAQRAGGVEIIIMHQGEADTNAHRTEAQYEADFATLIGHYREDLYAGIPIFICQLGTIDLVGGDARTNADVQAVRNAQHDLDNGTNIFMAATAMDQPRSDEVHYTRQGLDAIGGRITQAIKYYLGAASYYRGPAINSATFAGNRSTIDVQIVHRGGNDFTPASGITGFSVLSNGSPLGITSAIHIDANRIRLTLTTSTPQGAAVTLRYLWGADPDNTGLVKDNSSLVLPLENTTTEIIVTSTNTPPAAINNTYSVNEDSVLTIASPGVLGNDTDADGNPITAVKVGNPAHGTLTVFNADGSFNYTPTLNYNGSDTFTYKVNDGQADSNIATVTMTVSAVNDAPLAVNDGYNVTQGTVLTVNSPGVLGNDSDVDGDSLTAVLVTSSGHGILVLRSDGSFTYTPTVGYTGNDIFTYTAGDGKINSSTATVSITITASSTTFGLSSGTATYNESLNMLNAMRFQNTAGNGTLTKLELLFDDTTPNGKVRLGVYADNNGAPGSLLRDAGEVTVANGWVAKDGLSVSVTQNTYYWLVFDLQSANGVRYQSGRPANSHYWFQYTYGALPTQFTGAGSNNNQYVMRATVNAGNTPPVAVNDIFSAVKDTALNITAPGVLANDTDANSDNLTAIMVSGTGHGIITLNSNGSITYTPNPGYAGSDNFTYKANDGKTNSNVATVSITVTSPNNPPIAVNDNYGVSEDTILAVGAPGLLANDTDADGNTITAIKITSPAHGALTLNADGSFSYTPNANYNGSDSFTYKANDGNADSSTATVTMTVSAVNDAPLAVNDGYNVTQGTVLTINSPGVLGNDSDVDGDSLMAVLVTSSGHGILVLRSDGSFTYTPTVGYTGNDIFTYTASDGKINSNTATVSITITASSTTFGLSSGTATYNESTNMLNAMRFQNTAGNGTLTKLEILFDDTTPNGKVRLGVYADNNGAPGSLLRDAGEVTVANGWVAKDGLSLAVTQNTYYWLVFDLQSANGVRYQSGRPANSHYWFQYTYGALPTQFTGAGSNNNQYVIRATVAAGGL